MNEGWGLLRNVQEHRLVAFPAGAVLHEARAPTFDLNPATGLLLDMLDIGTALSDDLSTQVEPGNGLQVHGNPLLGPFTLEAVSMSHYVMGPCGTDAYPAIFIAFHRLRLAATEPSLVHQVGELLLHEVVDQLDRLLEAIFVRARHVEKQRRVLWMEERSETSDHTVATRDCRDNTAAVAMFLSG